MNNILKTKQVLSEGLKKSSGRYLIDLKPEYGKHFGKDTKYIKTLFKNIFGGKNVHMDSVSEMLKQSSLHKDIQKIISAFVFEKERSFVVRIDGKDVTYSIFDYKALEKFILEILDGAKAIERKDNKRNNEL